jgi:hypothetical protein
MTAPLDVDAFEERYAAYRFEAAEEARAVRVGEKAVSERAAVVARHAGLFTREQLDALRGAEDEADDGDVERVSRLRLVCEGGLATRELAEREDELENAVLATRVAWLDAELPLRTATARLAVEPAYADRDELGARVLEGSARLNDRRLELLRAREALEAELSGIADPVARSEAEKGIRLRPVLDAVDAARVESTPAFRALGERWLPRLLGDEREATPSSAHLAWIRRLSPLEETYPRERVVDVCTATLREIGFDLAAEDGILLDLEDRPQKSPRACVIASDPPRVVHLITRAMGGMHDYEAFLHEAGHALHYAGCDPSLPYAFRALARDHALTEIYSFLLDSIAREPGWHARHFGLTDRQAREHAQATVFVESLMFRRYSAKLGYELDFWSRFGQDGGTPGGYEERLTAATGLRYPTSQFVSDMDAGFYSADYLRAWLRAAQVRSRLRRDVGADWWCRPETGELLRGLFAEGTRPTTEDVADRLGDDPLDVAPLVTELTAGR